MPFLPVSNIYTHARTHIYSLLFRQSSKRHKANIVNNTAYKQVQVQHIQEHTECLLHKVTHP